VGAYDNGIEAMGGTIAPGKARTGTYGFVVPAAYRDDVVLEFSWDTNFAHEPAVFAGSLEVSTAPRGGSRGSSPSLLYG
jgi:hypothetical protein